MLVGGHEEQPGRIPALLGRCNLYGRRAQIDKREAPAMALEKPLVLADPQCPCPAVPLRCAAASSWRSTLAGRPHSSYCRISLLASPLAFIHERRRRGIPRSTYTGYWMRAPVSVLARKILPAPGPNDHAP
jgi:hypothetical protein